MAAMSHNTAMLRNIVPTGSRSNMKGMPRFGAVGAHCGDAGRRIAVSDFGDDGTESSVVGEEFSFAGFEFADSAVGLGELVVECAEGGSCWRHGTSS